MLFLCAQKWLFREELCWLARCCSGDTPRDNDLEKPAGLDIGLTASTALVCGVRSVVGEQQILSLHPRMLRHIMKRIVGGFKSGRRFGC